MLLTDGWRTKKCFIIYVSYSSTSSISQLERHNLRNLLFLFLNKRVQRVHPVFSSMITKLIRNKKHNARPEEVRTRARIWAQLQKVDHSWIRRISPSTFILPSTLFLLCLLRFLCLVPLQVQVSYASRRPEFRSLIWAGTNMNTFGCIIIEEKGMSAMKAFMFVDMLSCPSRI